MVRKKHGRGSSVAVRREWIDTDGLACKRFKEATAPPAELELEYTDFSKKGQDGVSCDFRGPRARGRRGVGVRTDRDTAFQT